MRGLSNMRLMGRIIYWAESWASLWEKRKRKRKRKKERKNKVVVINRSRRMDANEATTIVLSKIKGIDPENASKIMGYLLIQDLTDKDLIRLAFGPESLLHSLILKAKTQLGLGLGLGLTPPLLPLSSPRISPRCHLDPQRNNLSPFSPSVMSPGAAPFGGPRVGSPFFGGGFVGTRGGGGGGDFGEEGDYFPFLSDGGGGKSTEEGGEVEGHLHRRSYSENDVGFGHEDAGENGGGCCRPCLYFARGFCKNGSNCNFLHGAGGCVGGGGGAGDDLEGGSCGSGGAPSPLQFVGSPSGYNHEELLRLKVAHRQRLAAAAAASSQFMPGMSPPSPQGKYLSMLLQQQHHKNDAHRITVPGMGSGDEFYKFSPYQHERSDFLAIGLADKANSASRQIYLTFPADSTFKDEDVSEYFSNYGPVQDVRIPYQQKRMFGFVTFVYPETVKLILAKGNPHFICNSRVLVKPYKEKGKVPDKRHQQQLFERGDFSPSSSFSLLDSGEPYDHHPGTRAFHNSHEMMLRRKFEEQANLQQAIEMHSRRLISLQLPDLKDDSMYHHMRSLSLSSPLSPSVHVRGQFSPTVMPYNIFSRDAHEDCWNRPAVLVSSAAEEQHGNPTDADTSDNILASEQNGDSPILERRDSQERNSFDHVLPDSLFASPTKSSADHQPDFSKLAAAAGFAVENATTEIHVAPIELTTNNAVSADAPPSH
ncbi:hypothetical protein MLD38_004188 [Melastoma candidum]|uniref:Uncharacterized protein n=1 Tax=Melastoma candidum TaxID=119954 RepID=A0ACB9SDH7_9MYRT|nr:hypothetical protein MLD38_004188 [Melastoma candidum]